jgi:hypothetical protein
MRSSQFSEAQIIGIRKELKVSKKDATLYPEHGRIRNMSRVCW